MDDESDTAPWQRRISRHIAFGVIAYTVIQIALMLSVMRSHAMSMLPYVALIVLVAGVIPLARQFEKRWQWFAAAALSDAEIAREYRRSRIIIWASAIGGPFLLTAVFSAVAALV